MTNRIIHFYKQTTKAPTAEASRESEEFLRQVELDFNNFLEYWFSEIDLEDKLLKLYTENPSLIPARNQYNPESKLEKWFESFKGET